MSDTRVLLQGLVEYSRSLEKLTFGMVHEFSQLEVRWLALNEVYDGDAAEQFRAGWLRTVERFRAYQDGLDALGRALTERIAHLESFDDLGDV